MVTELVINALKHAFPGHRGGKIIVGYHSDNAQWSMSVSDNGVGVPTENAVSRDLATHSAARMREVAGLLWACSQFIM
ncbi:MULTISPECIES: sensor histidine kinase [Rhizobium]|uniref:sensor histidine kinase n=1 Tax=Rhizobium TaxID=379 RepID=UPI00195C9326|nr:sensor histidine kinase [Rhizobium lusitanum]MBM7049272.1 sensor histidine kinase [Rhizobium lusitanum]